MYGFVEEKLLKILGITEDKYSGFVLNCGAKAAIVDKDLFNKILETLINIHRALSIDNTASPICVDSDVVGMKIILSVFYYDDDVIDGLTGSNVKETTTYLSIKQMGAGASRFSSPIFCQMLSEYFYSTRCDDKNENLDKIDTSPISITNEVDENQNNVKDDDVARKIKSNEEKLFDERVVIREAISEHIKRAHGFERISEDEKNSSFIIGTLGIYGTRSVLQSMANQMNKDVYIISSAEYSTIIRRIKENINIKDLERHCVFIIYYFGQYQFSVVPNAEYKSMCFGEEVEKMSVVVGNNINKEICQIRDNRAYSVKEKNERVNNLLKLKSNSPYSKYDMIYKDTITGVVWAVRERCFVYLMAYACASNSHLFTIIYTELVRRYEGKVSRRELRKIDFDYQSEASEKNRESYIEFAIQSSRSILNELKKNYKTSYDNYTKLWDQLLESGKMMKKYQDQIEAFDENAQKQKEKEKAEKLYDDTIAIDKVSAIYVKGESIHVYTKNIYAQDDRTKRWHDIGTFHIKIGMMSNKYDTESTIKIKNTKHQIKGLQDGMEAPHVFPNGYICHGNAEAGLATAYVKRDLYQLVLQIILFLSYANTDDSAGKHIDQWPEVSEEEATFIEPTPEHMKEIKEEINEAEKAFDEGLDAFLPVRNS